MLGKALYRRNRKKVEKVIPGSQTFSSNGTFVVPYETALYSITIVAGARASGRGGDGGDGGGEIDFPSMSVYAGGGGGGGGGTSNNFRVSTNTFSLTKGQSISITCNYSLVSFGSYISVSTGTAARDGTDGQYGTGTPGDGGSGEGSHSISTSLGYSTSGTNSGSSGRNGSTSSGPQETSYGYYLPSGTGGRGGSLGGGAGGDGGDCELNLNVFQVYGGNGERGSAGSYSNRNGSITISWVAP